MALRSSIFTKGGQTQLHKIRMLRQVISSTLKISLICGVLGWLLYFAFCNHLMNLLMFPAYALALLMSEAQKSYAHLNNFCFFILNGKLHSCQATWFLANCTSLVTHLKNQATICLYFGGGTSLLSTFLVVSYFLRKGLDLERSHTLSGFELKDLKSYMSFLKKHKIKSELSIDGIPLPFESEVKHFMVTGTTGSGKTNAVLHLLKELKARGDKVVIVDTTGGYVSRFYTEGKDTILNPLDTRSANWNLFKEVDSSSDAPEIASFLVRKQSNQSEFWSQAARLMLSEGIEVTKRHIFPPSVKALQSILLKESFKDIQQYFKDSSISSYFSENHKETANSIRITLATSINSLECLKEDGEFSIKQWVKDDTVFIF